MKNTLIAIILLGFLLSCSNGEDANLELERNPDNDLTGKWQLTEQLMDPGDGSGTFTAVESDHTIAFLNEGTFNSSEPLCYTGGDSNKGTKGSVDADEKVLIPDGCVSDETLPSIKLRYELQESNLIVYLLCIEPCALKFSRVD